MILHGAGSFGHHEAKEFGLGCPAEKSSSRCLGAAVTHAAVQQLSSLVVAALIANDVPAVNVSPMGSWHTNEGPHCTVRDNWGGIRNILAHGLVPVLHGDVALDDHPSHHTCILSGDTLMAQAAHALPLAISVFISGVDGLYDRPPELPSPHSAATQQVQPARRIARAVAAADGTSLQHVVFANGELLSLQSASDSRAAAAFQSSTDAHDVTGGIAGKVQCALQVSSCTTWRPSGVPVLLTGVHHDAATMEGILLQAAGVAAAPVKEHGASLKHLESTARGTLVLTNTLAKEIE